MVSQTEHTKKRILYFIPEFPRLTETFIEREVSELTRQGIVDVKVISLKKASGVASEEVLKVTDYKRLSWLNAFLALKYFFTRPQKVLKAWSKAPDPYLFLKSLGYAVVFEKYQPDHIHVHFFSDPSTMALIISTILEIPFSVSGHALDLFVDGKYIKEKVESSKFVTVCNTLAYNKCLEEVRGEYKDKIFKIFHGVDAVKLKFSRPSEEPGHKPYILTVARLVEKKGLQYLIESSSILRSNGIEHEMHIAGGPGGLYEELTSKIKASGLENTVFIHGEGKGVPYEEVLKLYEKADVFVLPSIETGRGDVDGVPNVIVEASLACLPVVTTDAGSISDLIVDDETGIVVDQRNSQALAAGIERVLRNPRLKSKISENAYKKALETFNLENNIRRLSELFLI